MSYQNWTKLHLQLASTTSIPLAITWQMQAISTALAFLILLQPPVISWQTGIMKLLAAKWQALPSNNKLTQHTRKREDCCNYPSAYLGF